MSKRIARAELRGTKARKPQREVSAGSNTRQNAPPEIEAGRRAAFLMSDEFNVAVGVQGQREQADSRTGCAMSCRPVFAEV